MMRPKSAMFYISSIEEISTDFVSAIVRTKDANGETDDLLEHINPWALESIASIFLNTRLGCLDPVPSKDGLDLIKAAEIVLGPDLFRLVTKPPLWKYIPLPAFKRFDRAAVDILTIAKKFIEKAALDLKLRKDEVRMEGEKSILEKLIESNKGDLDIPVVMAVDAMLAGIDTTGNTAAFLIYRLANNPEQQEMLFKEVVREVGEGRVTEAALRSMKYLRACHQESMRMAPAASGISRRTQADMGLGGYAIPRKTSIIYFSVNNLLSPDHYLQPDKFLPERWLRGGEVLARPHSHLNLPFGHGPRMCIGRRFAELELHVLIIKLLQKFR